MISSSPSSPSVGRVWRAVRLPRAGAATCLCLGLSAAATSYAAFSQDAAPKAVPTLALRDHPDLPKADPADVASIDAIVAAFANAVSAPAGGTLDRARLNTLFVPEGRIVIGAAPRPGRDADVAFVSPDAYADLSDGMTQKKGFFDRVIANHIDQFGVMAHVWSSYESRDAAAAAAPFARGIKSFELLTSGDRWYIVQVFYGRERDGNPLPSKYLATSSP